MNLQSEPKYRYINVHSNADGEWYGAVATLDTGSDENWISQDVVDRLRLKVFNGLLSKFKTFNGEIGESDSAVRATWSRHGRGTSHITFFRVVSNAPFDILFGRNFLLSGEVDFFSTEFEPSSVLVKAGLKLTASTPLSLLDLLTCMTYII